MLFDIQKLRSMNEIVDAKTNNCCCKIKQDKTIKRLNVFRKSTMKPI